MIYIYYDKNTKIYKGNEFREKKDKHKECDCLKIEEKDWLDFINTYPEVIKVIDGKLTTHNRVRSLQELKDERINSRKAYRKQMFEEWFDDLENIPQDVKTKLKDAKDEIEEIKNATEETINNYLTEF